MAKEIKFIISQNGDVTIDATGFTGNGCLIGTQEIANALGEVVSLDKKPEYYVKATGPEVIKTV